LNCPTAQTGQQRQQGFELVTNAKQQSMAVQPVTDGPTGNGRFAIATIAASFPNTANTLLVDEYPTNRAEASARVFRVYRPTPPHYHATRDEYLYVFSGRGTFRMEDPTTEAEFKPGQLLFFARNTVHAMPNLFEHPVVFLSVDTPRRDLRVPKTLSGLLT
jgi:mannose-6-phosphate isomerase-like protein (cupin superfamily)